MSEQIELDFEDWRPVPGYEDCYEVSSHGQVRRSKPGRSTKKGRPIKAFPVDKGGYLGVSLCRDGKQKTHRLARLVAGAFLGPPPTDEEAIGGLCEVHHEDNDPNNNRADNLEWKGKRANYEEMWHRYQ